MVEQNTFALLLVLLSATSAGLLPVIGPLRAAIAALTLAVAIALALWTPFGSYLGIRSFAARDPHVLYFRRRVSVAVLVACLAVGLAAMNPLQGPRSSDVAPNTSAPSPARVAGIFVGGGSTLELKGSSVISSGTGVEVQKGSTARLSRTRIESGVVGLVDGELLGALRSW
jgi:hypothetical protein